MIQRVQTLYLLLATTALVATLFLPLGVVMQTHGTEHAFFTALGVEEYCPMGYAALLVLSALISLAAVFLWKNRKFQMRIAIFGFVITLASYLVYFIYRMTSTDTVQYGWSYANLLPLLAMILTLLAVRAIRCDEKLIRSLDRIR